MLSRESRASAYADPFPAFENPEWLTTRFREYPVEFEYPYVLIEKVILILEDDSIVVGHLPGMLTSAIPILSIRPPTGTRSGVRLYLRACSHRRGGCYRQGDTIRKLLPSIA